MEINCKFEIKMLDGKVIENAKSEEFISNALLVPTFAEGSVVKKYTLAQKIYNEGKIEVDKDDFELIIKALKNPKCGVVPLVQAQLLNKLDIPFK